MLYNADMKTIRKADGFKNEYLYVVPDSFLEMARRDELFSSLKVTDIGYFPRAQYHFRQRPKGCGSAILLCCDDGKGVVAQNGGTPKALEAGQAVLIPPNTPHWYSARDDDPWSIFWMHVEDATTGVPPGVVMDLSPAARQDIAHTFYRCFDLLKAPYQREEYYLLCQLAGVILAGVVCGAKQAALQLTQKGESAIDACILYMKGNLARPANLAELAAASGFSPSHLSALFTKATGHAPVDYFLRMKIQAASNDLFFTQRTAKEIAMDYGFQDPYYFSRLFKQIMGVSPTAYRRQAVG